MFETGRGDNFAVTDAENAYQQAQNQMLNAQADVAIAAYRLLRTLGILLEAPEELKPAAAARWK
jgi:outer membrane protein TolC